MPREPLFAAGNIRAAQDGKDLAGPKELPQTQIGKVTLYKEDEPPSVSQRLAVKGLLTAAGVPYEAGQEGAQLSALLQRLKDHAARAGGSPPLPEAPDVNDLDALLALGGNQQFRVRLFPKFKQGDNANWGKVVTKAREGAPDALDAVGHHGEPTTHAVCKEVLAAITLATSSFSSPGTRLRSRAPSSAGRTDRPSG